GGGRRGTSNVVTIVAIYTAALLGRHGRRREVLLLAGLAAVVAFALGAVQILPGLKFLTTSQRERITFDFFTASSLRLQLLIVQFIPYVFGGLSTLHLVPTYGAAGSRIPEVNGYVGLLALVALFTIGFWRTPRYTRLGAWFVFVIVGLVLAMGGHTPLGRVLFHLPLYGNERFQGRNLAITDLGLAGVSACWVDALA